jgi:hypothetical protein
MQTCVARIAIIGLTVVDCEGEKRKRPDGGAAGRYAF